MQGYGNLSMNLYLLFQAGGVFSLEAGTGSGEIYAQSRAADAGVSAHAIIISAFGCSSSGPALFLAVNGGG